MSDEPTIIGRIGVKVSPDASKFRKELKPQLEKIEKRLSLKVQVVPDVSAAAKRHMQQQLKQLTNDLRVNLRPDVDTSARLKASAKLAELSRTRDVRIAPKLDKVATAKVASALASLSGLKILGNLGSTLRSFFASLVTSMPKIAGMALGLVSLGAAGLSAAANLASLSASLASIAPLALALPGMFAGAALGVTALVVALKDTTKYLPKIKAQWQRLEKTISDNFWAKAAAPIRSLVADLLPKLTTGFAKVSTQLGSLFGNLAASLKGKLDVSTMFGSLSKSIGIVSKSTGSITNIVNILGKLGSGILPDLARWFDALAAKVSAWLSEAEKTGRLTDLIHNAVDAAKALGSALGNTGRILAGIGKAALGGGGSTLGSLAATLGTIARIVNGAGFQSGLSNVIASAKQATSTIADLAGPAISNALAQLGQTLTAIVPVVGDAVGKLGGALGTLLGSAGLQSGLRSLFDGIDKGVTALVPALDSLGPVLASLGGFMGKFAAMLGPVLGAAIKAIAPLVSSLLDSLGGVATKLGGALLGAIKAITPALQRLAPIIAKLASDVGDQFAGALKAATPALATLANTLASVLKVLQPVLPLVVDLWLGFKAYKLASTAATAVKGFGATLAKTAASARAFLLGVGGKNSGLATMFDGLRLRAMSAGAALKSWGSAALNGVKAAASLVAALVKSAAAFVAQGVAAAASAIKAAAVAVANGIATAATAAWAAATAALDAVLDANPITLLIVGIVALVAALVAVLAKTGLLQKGWSAAWAAMKVAAQAVVTFVTVDIPAAWDAVVSFVTKLPGRLAAAGAKLWTWITDAWSVTWGRVKEVWSAAVDFVGKLPGRLASAGAALWGWVLDFYEIQWDLVVSGFKTAISLVSGLPGKFASAGAGIWHWVATGLSDAWQSCVDTFRGILTWIGNLVPKVTDIGNSIWQGLVSGLEGALNGAISLIDSAIGGINHLIDMTNKLPFVSIPHVPTIPHLAEGATILPRAGGTLALLGEAGKAESVVDTGKLNKMLDRALAKPGPTHDDHRTFVYNAAPGSSLGAEQDLFAATRRAHFAW